MYDSLNPYGDGLTLTRGSSASHIWSFISGWFSGTSVDDVYMHTRCPCDPGNTYTPPSFVGNDYFCDSVVPADVYLSNPYQFYPNNSLWDGQDLLNPCYALNNPPWFFKTLNESTTDDITAHLCLLFEEQRATIVLEQLEIYVK